VRLVHGSHRRSGRRQSGRPGAQAEASERAIADLASEAAQVGSQRIRMGFLEAQPYLSRPATAIRRGGSQAEDAGVACRRAFGRARGDQRGRISRARQRIEPARDPPRPGGKQRRVRNQSGRWSQKAAIASATRARNAARSCGTRTGPNCPVVNRASHKQRRPEERAAPAPSGSGGGGRLPVSERQRRPRH
jgi:hypothetical protein